jgi:hypothetical protein
MARRLGLVGRVGFVVLVHGCTGVRVVDVVLVPILFLACVLDRLIGQRLVPELSLFVAATCWAESLAFGALDLGRIGASAAL